MIKNELIFYFKYSADHFIFNFESNKRPNYWRNERISKSLQNKWNNEHIWINILRKN